MPAVACFVTPHGFGHAARASAVMEALHTRRGDVSFEIFTGVPEWFFADSLTAPYGYHEVATDVGLVQRSSLEEDPAATVEALHRFLPFSEALLEDLAGALGRTGCRLVIADIAPLGLAVAGRAGVPSVLIENFTWDWVYGAYVAAEPRLEPYRRQFRELFGLAGTRLQTAPVCAPTSDAVELPPMSRRPRLDRSATRERLGLAADGPPMVLLTMGGIRWQFEDLEHLQRNDLAIVVPGAVESPERLGNLILLPHRSGFHHADLVSAADLLVGKVGYSTVAEAWAAGTPFLYLERPAFPESPILAAWLEDHLPAARLDPEELATGAWIDQVGPLLAAPRPKPAAVNGATKAAEILDHLLG